PAKTEARAERPARAPAKETAPKETPKLPTAKSAGNGGSALQLAREASARADQKAAVRLATWALDVEPDADEALAIRAHALTLRESYRAALADLRRLPESRFAAQPELWADLFVCLVSTKERAEARGVAANVPAAFSARADVARARKTLGIPLESGELAAPSPSPTAAAAAVPRPRAKELLAAVAKDPKNRDLRKELLEAAYLAKDWETGASQIAVLEPFQDGEEAWMFYAAVSAWEIGRQDAARTLFRRARPRISDD